MWYYLVLNRNLNKLFLQLTWLETKNKQTISAARISNQYLVYPGSDLGLGQNQTINHRILSKPNNIFAVRTKHLLDVYEQYQMMVK
jgi:hypothetical protein